MQGPGEAVEVALRLGVLEGPSLPAWPCPTQQSWLL